MNEPAAPHGGRGRLIAAALGGIALVGLLLYLSGTLRPGKVKPGTVEGPPEAAPGETAVVTTALVSDPREFVGTIRPRSVAQVSAKILARVLEVSARMGETVEKGQLLARLDDRDVRARVEQARLGLTAAQAQLAQAESDLKRQKFLAERKATTPAELEGAEAHAQALRADVARLGEAEREAEVFLGEAEVRAPVAGRVLERLVEPGDMAAPGRPLVTIEAATGLRIEAWVPEACARTVQTGDRVTARLDATRREIEVTLEEIAPASDPASHSFLVKAAIPDGTGARPGEFARLIRPCAARVALLVPASAVHDYGQLELVHVVEDGKVRARHVRTGKLFDGHVEILAGLLPGERVLIGRAP